MSHSLPNKQMPELDIARYRSGVAARLAGLPVETLRVWERRYGLSDTGRSAHGQRLYSDAQVSRLRLIKQLVDQGHPVGALAPLSPAELQSLQLLPTAGDPTRIVRVAVVGCMLVQRLARGGREVHRLDIVARLDRLSDAVTLPQASVDVLLVELDELDAPPLPLLGQLRGSLGAAVVVLYRFCSSATLRQLRTLDCVLARAPGDLAEIVMLCQSASSGQARPAPVPAPIRRTFDDQALAALGAARSNVSCECPRHLSEILLMLNSFERYSEQCAARTPDDAVLHGELQQAAARARALLEVALVRLARAEGLPLPGDPQTT